jgi:hypothetical protein
VERRWLTADGERGSVRWGRDTSAWCYVVGGGGPATVTRPEEGYGAHDCSFCAVTVGRYGVSNKPHEGEEIGRWFEEHYCSLVEVATGIRGQIVCVKKKAGLKER